MKSKVIFRFHALQRMFERRISEEEVLKAITEGKIIEDYPDDSPYPSCLKLVWIVTRPIHIVLATNQDEDSQIVITVYEPDLKFWDQNFEKRKK